jgi:hypothetical protein
LRPKRARIASKFRCPIICSASHSSHCTVDLFREKFIIADGDDDGKLTFHEWFAYMTADKRRQLALKWAQYDTEGKGFLTMKEAIERKV